MSAEKQGQDIDEEIHDYIDSDPRGRTREQVHKKFGLDYMNENENKEEKYSQKEIDNALDRLDASDWIFFQGRTIRSIKVR